MAHNFKILVDAYKKSAVHDPIGLYEIIGTVEKNYKPKDAQILQELTLEFVNQMLAEGFVVGNLERSKAGYLAWSDQSLPYVISRIMNEWQALGRKPNIGDIAYFNLPNS